MSNKPNMIFISAHLPSINVPQAGQKIAYEKLKNFSKTYDIILIAFVNSSEEPYMNAEEYQFCTEVYFIKVSKFQKLLQVIQNPFIPIRMAVRYNRKAKRLIKKIISTKDILYFHAEYTGVGIYISMFPKDVHTTITEHDLIFQSLDRLQKQGSLQGIFYAFEFKRQKKYELNLLKQYNKTYVLNKKDKDILLKHEILNVEVQFPKLQKWVTTVQRNIKTIQKNTILFWGAMDRFENQDAIIYFLDEILPLVEKEVRIEKIFVVGANPSANILALQSEKISITGFVESPKYFFEKAQIGIVPLRYGAGIKIKTLEMIAAKVPTISTTIGAEGIEKDPLLFEENDNNKFSKRIIKLLKETAS